MSGLADPLDAARWSVPPTSSRLLAWHDAAMPPDPRTMVDAASRVGLAIESVEMLESGPPVAWTVLARETGAPPWVLWCEPTAGGEVPPSAVESRWIIGLETLIAPPGLDESASQTLSRHRVMKQWLHAAGATSALLDPTTGRWLDAVEWSEDRSRDSRASLEELWCVRAHRRPGASLVWLSTEGLHRCGRPELELLEIPEALAAAGAAVLDGVAALLLESPPPPETPWRIGPASEVSLERIEEVLPALPASAPGSLEDRRRLDLDASVEAPIAVVCASERRGTYRRLPVPPIELLERVGRGEVGLYRSRHEVARLRRLVAEQAGLLDRIARSIESGRDGLRALVSTSAVGADTHEWAELVGAAAEGWFVQPVDLAGRAVVAAPASIAGIGSIADWQVELEGRRFGPDEAASLEAALEASERPASVGESTP